jgi:hypothetical protein
MEAANGRLETAVEYARRGWPVLPLWWPVAEADGPVRCACGDPDCPSVAKHPLSLPGGAVNGVANATIDEAELHRWWTKWPLANIGIATGRAAGLLVLDVDGPAGLESVRGKHLPETPCVRTSQGFHYYYRHPEVAVKNQVRLLPGLDIRTTGGYVVAAGSTHRSGVVYEWALHPEEFPLADCPTWLHDLLREEGRKAEHVAPPVAEQVVEGHRNATLASIAGTMRRRGMGEASILAALLAENERVCHPPLDRSEVAGIAASIAKYTPTDRPPQGPSAEALLAEVERQRDAAIVWDAIPALARLDKSEYAKIKGQLKDILRDRLNLNDLDAAVREERRSQRRTSVSTDEERATVVVGRQLRDVAGDALRALHEANVPPVLFVRSGSLVRLTADECGRPVIGAVGIDELRGRLAEAARFVRLTDRGERDADPPEVVTRTILAAGVWPFPPLEALVEVPVLRPDGTVLCEAGYDPATRLVFVPAPGLAHVWVSSTPSGDDVAAARSLLEECIGDFPYADVASKANAFALLLTPIVRPAIEGHVPLALLDAPQAGTGKTLLGEAVSLVATGRRAAMFTAPVEDPEWAKQITAALQTGATIVMVDNAERPIEAPSLAMALTTGTWQTRLLGRNDVTLILPQRATWIVTGNNITLRGDLARRCYWVRLDAKLSRPWERTGFKHPGLVAWVTKNRGRLVAALLTLARAWFAAGAPEAEVPVLGSFEPWARIVGGILGFAGIEGFLANEAALHDQADEETGQWEGFLQSWYDCFGERPVLVGEVAQEAHLGDSPELKDSMPDTVMDKTGEVDRRKLGWALKKKAGVRFGRDGLYLHTESKARNSRLWVVSKTRQE